MKFSKDNWKPNKHENWLELNVHLIENLISDEKIIKALINGVPDSFAPFSSFNKKENYVFFQTLNDFYDDEFYNGNEYIVFGSDGEGNPFCIDKLNENKIVLLDFDGEKIISTNNSLSEYLDSILTYKNFNDAIIIKYGEDALFDNLYKEEDIEMLKNQFLKINANLVTNSEFWKYQIEELVANKNASS